MCQINMGEQFWWFYDVLAVAIILVCAFLSARKGFTKAVFSMAGYLLSFAIAISACSGFAESFYKGSVKSSNAKKITKNVSGFDFVFAMADYLDQTYPQITVDTRQLKELYKKNTNMERLEKSLYTYCNSRNASKVDTKEGFTQKLHEGYGRIVYSFVKDGMTKYAAESASKEVVEHPETFYEILPKLFADENSSDVGEYIAANYIKDPYEKQISLVFYVIFVLAGSVLTFVLIKGFSKMQRDASIGSRTAGGFAGIVSGLIFCTVAAAIVRLNVILGNDEMLFFNFKAVDKTYIFKYMYNFILSKT